MTITAGLKLMYLKLVMVAIVHQHLQQPVSEGPSKLQCVLLHMSFESAKGALLLFSFWHITFLHNLSLL